MALAEFSIPLHPYVGDEHVGIDAQFVANSINSSIVAGKIKWIIYHLVHGQPYATAISTVAGVCTSISKTINVVNKFIHWEFLIHLSIFIVSVHRWSI